jgi:hypothetical protein
MPTMTGYLVRRSPFPSVRGLSHKRQRVESSREQIQAIGQGLFGGLSCIRAEPSAAPDRLQRPLLRRSRFQRQVSASVRHL